MRKVASAHLREGVQKILDRRGGAVAGLEVAVHAAPEIGLAEQRLQHAYDLGALLVDGRRVKIVDLAVARRRSEEHTSELQSRQYIVCRLLLETKKAVICNDDRHV